MKKTITTTLMALATAYGFAQEAVPATATETFPSKIHVVLDSVGEKLPKNSFRYLRTDLMPIASVGMAPGLGFGYRLISDASAIDFTVSGAATSEANKAEGNAWMAPRISYLRYLTAESDNSIYVGGGIGLGGIRTEAQTVSDEDDYSYHRNRCTQSFSGLIANATIGYEFARNAVFRSFAQLEANQPCVAAHQKGAFPHPWATFSVGAGF